MLRERVRKTAFETLERKRHFEPLSRRLALALVKRLAGTTDADLSARVIAAAARLEAAIPASKTITRFVRSRQPDVVLVNEVVKHASRQVEYLKSARALGIPAATCVASWDNLTNKGLLKFVPERVFVWNDIQRDEAVQLHGIPPDRVVATGAQVFDMWFERTSCTPREVFMERIGLDHRYPYVVYVGSSPFVRRGHEVPFVLQWIEGLRSSDDERLRELGVVVRPHPIGHDWRNVDLSRFGNAVIWPIKSNRPFVDYALADFHDTLTHSASVVGINTTAMIEAAIVGKSVLTVLDPEFAQEATLHFHYLREEKGGFVNVASSLDEHMAQLARVIRQSPEEAVDRRFVASFVRPHGLDQPVTPIFADAVEELARLPVSVTRPPWLLRMPLMADAGLGWLVLGGGRAFRRTRRRLIGKARRHGLLAWGSRV